jgi:methionine-rich copper-binding protein CopC
MYGNSSLYKRKMEALLCAILAICLTGFGCLDSGSGNSASGTHNDASPPARISLAGISSTDSSITFTWNDPVDSDFDHVVITCSDGTNTETTNVNAGKETYTQSTLNSIAFTASTLYTFTARSADRDGNLSGACVFYVKTAASGSAIDFTKISDIAGLQNMASNRGGNYLLLTDLDLSGISSWTPVSRLFSGIFNGNGRIIKNMTIVSTSDNQSLIGYAYGAIISSLGLESINVKGRECTGGLVGTADGSTTITNCYVTGKVEGSSYETGGLVGLNLSSTIINCYSTAEIKGYCYTGGLVGQNTTSSVLKNSYAMGSVTGTDQCTGGLTGNNYKATIINCYSTGKVEGSINTGALSGGSYLSTETSCYFDETTTGYDAADGSWSFVGKPMTTAQMKMTDTSVVVYDGWDFVDDLNGSDDTWSIDKTGAINNGYPYLTDLVP